MIHCRGPGAQAPGQEAYFDVVDCTGVVHSMGQTNMRKSLPLSCLDVVAVLAIVLKLHHRSACPCDNQGSETFISSD